MAHLWVVVVATVLSAVGWGQSAQSPVPRSTDVFADWRASANDAADRALAAVLSDRPWMQAASPAPAMSGTVARTTGPVGRLRAGIERVTQLRPTIEPILRQEGVSTELSAIVLVESGGIPTALSPKGARGVWQFMPGTARRYGLVVSAARDDRLDIGRSTRAAARYLRDLYQQFGNWQLAFAAYNAGEQAVDRALGRTGQRDFFAIRGALPHETRDYVPAVLQAMATLGGNTSVSTPARDHGRSDGRVIYASAEEDTIRN
jgi:hypothetical protein